MNMLEVATMVAGAGSLRKEIGGPHLYLGSFQDIRPLPRDDQNWCKHIIIKSGTDGLDVELRELHRKSNLDSSANSL